MEGDDNTKIFHKIVKDRNIGNLIWKLEAKEGLNVDYRKVDEEFTNCFSNLYSNGKIYIPLVHRFYWASIRKEHGSCLKRRLEVEEIKMVIFQRCQ